MKEEMTSDTIELKAALLVEGINATKEALAGVGTKYKEQNHGLFGWDMEEHADCKLPDDFLLPDGTVVQFRLNSSSPFSVLINKEILRLYHGDNHICDVQWIKRPEFYNHKIDDNKKMVQIGQVGGEDCLFFCYQNYCSHFSSGQECLFCNLVSTSKTSAVLKKKDTEMIGEVSSLAWEEGIVNHILLTGGCFAHESEVSTVEKIIASIKKHVGKDRIPGTILPSPAKGDDIKRYYNTGIQAIGYSMEIWDEALYQAICPGKAKTTSDRKSVV